MESPGSMKIPGTKETHARMKSANPFFAKPNATAPSCCGANAQISRLRRIPQEILTLGAYERRLANMRRTARLDFRRPARYAVPMSYAPQIISASRRTDLPAFYVDWFVRRLNEGFCITRNPMNPGQARRVSLSLDDVACIVFWSKNPSPLLSRLDALAPYPWYLQFTLNAYDADIEPGLPDARARLNTFLRLSDRVGPARVLWRYDPICISPRYPAAFHIEAFARLCEALAGHTERCTISFFDLYAKNKSAASRFGIRRPNEAETADIAAAISVAAKAGGLILSACAEAVDLSPFGIVPARCVDPSLISRIARLPVSPKKDKNQRPACGCAPSVDVGAYHSCTHGCVYCYANHSPQSALVNRARHDPSADSM